MEYRNVALRPEHHLLSGYSSEDMIRSIELIEGLAETVDISTRHRPLSSDRNDDMVWDVAINGAADAIITMNKRHFVKPAAHFGIPVLTPAELLQKMRGENDAQ